ncbi:MAG: S1 RNA-binding domain-containing protein [Pseudomonadota bacterium]
MSHPPQSRLRKPASDEPKADEGAAAELPAPRPRAAPAPAREPYSTEGLEALAQMDPAAFGAAMDQATTAATGFEPGQQVSGLVVRMDSGWAFVDLGGKSEARIALEELQPEEAQLGATVEARILRVREDGVELSRQVRGGGLEALEAAMSSGIPVEGRVESRNSGGYVVRLAGARGFCPVSQIDRFPGRDLDRFVGMALQFRVMEVREREVVLTRKALQEVEAQEAQERFWATVKRGEVLEGVVTSVREYGAFVDLGGVEGLIHKSEMGWGGEDKPEEVLKRWDPVRVKVVEIDPKRKRVALSMRLPENSPWTRVGTDFVLDGTYEGTVVRIEDFGAFVELAAGLQGLLRTPNISWDHIDHPSKALEVGQKVEVKILEIEDKRHRLDLGMRQLQDDPLQVMADKYPVGEEVSGMVQRVDRMGVQLLVDDSVIAWIPAREVELPPGVLLQQRIRRGAHLKARVVELDRQRRQLKLSQTSDSDAAEQEARKELKRQARQSSSLGTFAELLSGIKVKE